MERTYTAIIERDIASGWFIASVAELPGCFTQAPDRHTLAENIKDAIRTYLADEAIDEEELTEYIGVERVTVPVSIPLSA